MKRWFHSNAVWPSPSVAAVFILVYGIFDLGLWLIQLAAPALRSALSEAPEIRNIRVTTLGLAAGLYAVYRLWRFHPACNREYAAWLSLSPWTAARPLPLGPIHLVWQDLVVLAALCLIAGWHARVDPMNLLAVFGLIYLGGLTCLLAVTRRWAQCVMLGFLWPALMLPAAAGWPTAGLIVAIALVVWHGQRQSLRTFPWGFLDQRRAGGGSTSLLHAEVHIGAPINPASGKPYQVGWPWAALSPKPVGHSIGFSTSFWLSALVGWWMFCALARLQPEPFPEFILLFGLSAAGMRLLIYCAAVVTPFNLWSRIATGRLVIPGFDRVFVTPAVAVLAATIGGMVVRRSGTWLLVAESAVVAVVCFVLLAGGPTLQNWLLTGQHRFRVPARFLATAQSSRATSFRPTG
jgi:hypothetical protein